MFRAPFAERGPRLAGGNRRRGFLFQGARGKSPADPDPVKRSRRSRNDMRALLLAVILLTQGPRLYAAQSSAAQFLNLGFGARALGMGEAYTAVSDDISSVYYNPAGLASGPEGRELSFSHAFHLQDTAVSQAAFMRRPTRRPSPISPPESWRGGTLRRRSPGILRPGTWPPSCPAASSWGLSTPGFPAK